MKKSIFITLLAAAFVLTISACNRSTTPKTDVETTIGEMAVYTCPMHPEVQKDEPGECPVCGMDLVEKGSSDSTYMHDHSDSMYMH